MASIDNPIVPVALGGYYLQRTFYENIEWKGGAIPVLCFTDSNMEASMRLSFFNASVPQFLLHVKSNSVLSFDLYGVLRVVSAPRRLNYS